MSFISKPLEWLVVTFPYGAAYPQVLVDKGLTYHMGTDWRTDGHKKILAVMNGKVDWIGTDRLGGNMLRILSEYKNKDGVQYEFRYAHLEKIFIKQGSKVKVGDELGLTGNTGIGTTGQHLHGDLKLVTYSNGNRKILDYDNGLWGCVDIAPYLKPSVGYCELLPCDSRYNRKYSYWAEFKLRFKNPWIHRQLIKVGRDPLSLTQREMQGLCYGGWDWDTVMNPAMYPIWATLKKSDYEKGVKVPIRLTL